MKTVVAIAHADQIHDGAMPIIDSWAVEMIEHAAGLGYTVVDISGPDLTYERTTGILAQTKPALLINFSLGRKTCLIGNPVNGMIGCTLTQGDGMPSNLHAVSGIAVISYSNYAGGQLGQNMVRAGCPALLGFSEDLIVVSDKDGTQNIFKDSLLPLAKRVLEGLPAGEAVEATRSDLLNIVKKYKAVKLISVPLYSNMKQLTLLGNPKWKLKRGLEYI